MSRAQYSFPNERAPFLFKILYTLISHGIRQVPSIPAFLLNERKSYVLRQHKFKNVYLCGHIRNRNPLANDIFDNYRRLKMKDFFKNLIDEVNNICSDFIHLETDKEENERLAKDFKNKVLDIKVKNYQTLMRDRLIPYVRDLELTNSGILLTDEQLFERAHNLFCNAKKDGKLDDLNRIVEV